jgi:NAD(P)-dependent dehydrogenase (short-subunit alcohol dehydrogenase family)/pimeloyl-ACP methyl ester carboxylesterase
MSHDEPTRTVRGDGIDLAVYESGKEGAPTVLFVHGFPDDHSVWSGVMGALEDRYRVVAYDVRGAGRSGVPETRGDYALAHLVADTEAVIDAVSGGRPVHLVGHDWGSIQSWETVAEPRMRAKIASFTSISGPCLDHVALWSKERIRDGALGDVVSQAMRSWYIYLFQMPRVPELLWRGGMAERFPRMIAASEGTKPFEPSRSAAEDAARGVELYRENIVKILRAPRERKTTVPVQAILPREDRYIAVEPYSVLGRFVEEAYFRRISGGHWVVRSEPARVARYVAEMVEHVEGGGTSPLLARARVREKLRPDEGKLVLITGAGSGIGQQTALAFARRGAEIVVADISPEGAEVTQALCVSEGATVHVELVDVSDGEAMERFAARVSERYGTPDVVVNNAGIGMAGPLLETSTEDWSRVLDVNVWGVIHGCRLFGRQMRERGEGGHIVNLSSAAAFMPSVILPAYATSKAAVLRISECLRAELAPSGVGVSAICPGVIDTPITSRTRFVGTSSEEEELRRARSRKLYAKRAFPPAAVALAIVDAVEKNRAVVSVSPEAQVFRWLYQLAPKLARGLGRFDLTPGA